MTRAYVRLDPAFDEHKAAYPDGPYAALIACFCLAELQTHRGRFRNEAYLRGLLGKRGRHLKYLVDQGDLIVLSDGRLYVDGWDEWQEGDWKVVERINRIRHRMHRNSDRYTDRSSDRIHGDSQTNPAPLSGSGSAGGAIAERPGVTPADGFKQKARAHGARVPE